MSRGQLRAPIARSIRAPRALAIAALTIGAMALSACGSTSPAASSPAGSGQDSASAQASSGASSSVAAPTGSIASSTPGAATQGSGASTVQASGSAKTYTIGLLEFNQSSLLTLIVDSFKKGISEAAPKGVTITFKLQNANGDQSLLTSIAKNFHQSDYDAFAVVGTPAVIAVAHEVTKRPVYALAMGDPVGAGLAQSLSAPGKNVTGSVDFIDPKLIVKQLQELQPKMTAIGTIFDPSDQNSEIWVKAFDPAASAVGLKLVQASIASTGDVATAANSLANRVQAIIIGPDAKAIAGIPAVSAVAARNDIPVYLSGGGDVTTPGVLAGIGANYTTLGIEAGKIAAKVIDGQNPAQLAFYVPKSVDLTINQTTLDKLKLNIPQNILAKAEIVKGK